MKALFAIAAVLLVAGCAAKPLPRMTYVPTDEATMSTDLALSQCSFQMQDNPIYFDRLYLLSGQSRIGPNQTVQGLNPEGMKVFSLCMAGKGFREDGWQATPAE